MNDSPNNNKELSSNKSTFFIYAYYKKSIDHDSLIINGLDSSASIIPFDCNLKIFVNFKVLGINNDNFLIMLNVTVFRSEGLSFSKLFRSTENKDIQNIPINLDLKK